MPLSFRSQNYGNIAFGFFNIESDMLLLENYFFFADNFCQWINKMANQDDDELKRLECQAYYIDGEDIGDLMGAMPVRISAISWGPFMEYALQDLLGKFIRFFHFPMTRKRLSRIQKDIKPGKLSYRRLKMLQGKERFYLSFLRRDK